MKRETKWYLITTLGVDETKIWKKGEMNERLKKTTLLKCKLAKCTKHKL